MQAQAAEYSGYAGPIRRARASGRSVGIIRRNKARIISPPLVALACADVKRLKEHEHEQEHEDDLLNLGIHVKQFHPQFLENACTSKTDSLPGPRKLSNPPR
jgi:hypothetical protein